MQENINSNISNINSKITSTTLDHAEIKYESGVALWHHRSSYIQNNEVHIDFGINVTGTLSDWGVIATIPDGKRGIRHKTCIAVNTTNGTSYALYYNANTGEIYMTKALPIGTYLIMSN